MLELWLYPADPDQSAALMRISRELLDDEPAFWSYAERKIAAAPAEVTVELVEVREARQAGVDQLVLMLWRREDDAWALQERPAPTES